MNSVSLYIIIAVSSFTLGHIIGYGRAVKKLKGPMEILQRIAEKYDWGNAQVKEN